jgi:hypothetical protein
MRLHSYIVTLGFLTYCASANVMQKPLQVLDIPQVFETWQILGPFPTGSREQDFGADPLEAYGMVLYTHLSLSFSLVVI